MSENALWKIFRENLGPYGKLVRIESSTGLGIPDVSYTLKLGTGPRGKCGSGWVELKHVPKCPPPDRPLVIKKLKKEQVDFLLDWSIAGGNAWCAIQVEREYFLVGPAMLSKIFEKRLPMWELRDTAWVTRAGSFPVGPMLRALVGELP